MRKKKASAISEQPAPPSEIRFDHWYNYFTGMGVAGQDNRTGWTPYARARDQERQSQLWLGDGLAGCIVELPAEEMTRARGTVELGDEKASQSLSAVMDELDVWAKCSQVLKYSRAHGGGALIMAVDDGFPWHMPVDTRTVRRVRALHTATPDELLAKEYYKNPANPRYGRPRLYTWRTSYLPGIDSAGITERLIHESRVIAFTGLETSTQRMVQNQGWGDSVLDRCEEPIRDLAAALAGLGVALNNFNQEVLKLKELGNFMKDKAGQARARERVAEMRLLRSMIGMLLIDSTEDYERKPITMGGVADTLLMLFRRLAAITKIPVPVLFGFTESGLGDTGRSAIDIWHQTAQAMQNNELRPALNRFIRLVLLSSEGPTGGVEPENWEVKFNPLQELTIAEQDARRKTQADIDVQYLDRQVISPADVARTRFAGPGGFSTSTTVDPNAFAPLAELPMQEGEPAAKPGPAQPQPAPAQALNGAQVEAANSIIERVATRNLPRGSGVAQLVSFFNLTEAQAEAVMGDVGRSFFAPAPTADAAPRVDSANEYLRLLVQELQHGALAEAEVLKKVAKLYSVSPRHARAIVEEVRAARADAAERTNFPRPGEDMVVSFKNSRWAVFDPAYAMDLKENWPEVWSLSSNPLGNTQFERLLPLGRAGPTGPSTTTPLEEHALRLREAWAARNAKTQRPAGVVALMKWLVVGRMGEAAMKRLIEQEKDRVRRRRAGLSSE